MNTHDPAPLTPEERALAQQLARLGPHAEPSPALDAAVLAAAHAAAPARTTRRRWPFALGIAASLALAVGIAWQLRPLPEAAVYDEAASADGGDLSVAAPAAGADAAAAPAAARDAVAAPPPPEEPPAAPEPEPASAPKSVAPAPPTRQAVVAQRVQASPPLPTQASDVAATGVAAPAPAPPPPPRAAPAPESAGTLGASASAGARAAPPATIRDAAGNAAEDAFVEDVPPATADSPQVREAWLQRIRELARGGDTGAARASLDEFMHRYPDHPVPDDLRALIE